MKLTFDIKTKEESTNLKIEFDDKECDNGYIGKLLAFEYLAHSILPDSELELEVCDLVSRELMVHKK
jgi:hypothetical protein